MMYNPQAAAAARVKPSSPPGTHRMSNSSGTTIALLPSQLSPAGQKGGEQELTNFSQEQKSQLEEIRQTAQSVNDYMRLSDTHLEFVVGEETGRIVIQVVDTDSSQIVRQIPPESVLRFGDTMNQLRGLLFQAQV